MAQITIKELAASTSAVIADVERGAAYIITKRGHSVAALMPIEEAEDLVMASVDEFVRQRREARADYAEGRTFRLEDLG